MSQARKACVDLHSSSATLMLLARITTMDRAKFPMACTCRCGGRAATGVVTRQLDRVPVAGELALFTFTFACQLL